MGTYTIEKQKKGKPRSLFTKDDLPEDKESFKCKSMVEFLSDFHLTSDEYMKRLQNISQTSIVSTNNIASESNSSATN
ncbi:unnamed protein product [Rotaria sordida]|uniref:Uncharacterized protein n=1 Tax=Rotaria sordida TaxID=392033 RepID=A0A815NG09_9BILA|nr:unnamed protein product [Rotaria sordida]CAF4013104.1 unnamed protein product [Rotaria sordida]